MRENWVKRSLYRGDLVVGTMVFEFSGRGIGYLIQNAGADYVVYDMEHTGWGFETIANMVSSTRGLDIVPIVRVAAWERCHVSRALDVGAMGVMMPMLESAAQARSFVSWAKYPPEGVRGAAFGIAHDEYHSGDTGRTMSSANQEVVLVGQIETVEGLKNVEEISAVDGLDVVWVGHYDLTNALGIPGQFEHPRYLEAVDRIGAAAQRSGKGAGFMASSVQEASGMVKRGYRCLAYSGDLWIYQHALAAGIGGIRKKSPRPQG
jgi:2-dehydro-3-deoxyglucarate aldolase/4-hydroxy-2-oxoheptanedioate aldolase